MAASPFLDAIRSRVVIYDGAAGTWLQQQDLQMEDYGTPELEGCPEILNETRPELIRQMHSEYFEAGADIVETNSFGGMRATLDEYGLGDRTEELNEMAARIAREAAEQYSTPDRARMVAGSIGPGTRFASLGHVSYVELRDQIAEQARGLLRGGVDVLLIETQFDLLGIKASMNGCRDAMAEVGIEVPLQVQVTIELTGRMLPGTEIGAALVALDPMRPDVIGINCATGPEEMSEHVRHLSQHSRIPVSVLPNAGLPSVVDGAMHYDLTPEQFVEHQVRFVRDFGISIVGGCCGTTPEYIRQLAAALDGLELPERRPDFEHGVASIYSPVILDSDEADGASNLIMIGERTNANGSKKFREAMLEADWDTCVAMAKDQVKEGSHVIDVCVDYVGRDGTADMDEIAQRFATQSSVPLVLDSTEPEVLESGLRWLGGRAMLNSVFLASVQSLIATLCCAMGGYGLVKFQFPLREPITLLVLCAIIIPGPLLLAPGFEMIYHLGLLDTYAGFLLPLLSPAFGVFLFRQAMINSVPTELIESARLDGCGEIRIFFQLVLPLVRPMVGAFLILSFLATWNNFVGPQLILQSSDRQPLSVAMNMLRGIYGTEYGLMMAGTLISVAPIMCLFLLLQREFISGLTSGAVKG